MEYDMACPKKQTCCYDHWELNIRHVGTALRGSYIIIWITYKGLDPGTVYKNQLFFCAEPILRNLSLTMMCSSSTQLYCMHTSTRQDVLTKVSDKSIN